MEASRYAPPTYVTPLFDCALTSEPICPQEGEEGVLELHGDHPLALYDMLQYLYIADYWALPLSEDLGDGYGSRWVRHLELAIVADKYCIDGLKKTALRRLEEGISLDSPSDIAKFAARALRSSIEEERLDAIILQDCRSRFIECFKHASFRGWLFERPVICADLCSRNILGLVRVQAFHDLIKGDGSLAMDILRRLAARIAERLFFDPLSLTEPASTSPTAVSDHELQADAETSEDNDDDSLDFDYESDQDLEQEEADNNEYYEYTEGESEEESNEEDSGSAGEPMDES